MLSARGTPEQPGLVECVPDHTNGVGTGGSLRSLPTETILGFCDFAPLRFFSGQNLTLHVTLIMVL